MILALTLIAFFSVKAQQTVKTKNLQDSIYDIQDSVMIRTEDDTEISAIVVRKKGNYEPKPTILQFTIYVRDGDRDLQSLKESADRGYIGVIAYTRGKRFSSSQIYPYEYDSKDAYTVIDWISRQPWSNGSIGMFGGSYNGFTQWAAAKNLHPALKTIVPYVANRPGMGLPMENNIFINPNYEWSFYVGNNRYLDHETGDNRKRFRDLMFKWWESGAPYNKMDSIDGESNHLFQRWIGHPDFDIYWQKMAPYKEEFARINIPILLFDGYYNDSQNSGLYYLRELGRYNPSAVAYLVIGPYSHFGTQLGGQKIVNGYTVSKSALFPIKDYTYQWFDYILKGGHRPGFLHDKINYQVMGTDQWKSAPSLDAMSNKSLKLYLSTVKKGNFYKMIENKPGKSEFLTQKVDFADRLTSNNDYYPDPIIRDSLSSGNGFAFVSPRLDEDILINGSFTGKINLRINKKDVDIGVTLYELTAEGKYFHLSYYIGRASYAKDMTKRQLLVAGKRESLIFKNTHLISKKLQKGSRLVIVLNVNKNPFSELNYGTGKIVSTESISDASDPLVVDWFNSSYVEIPVLK